MRFKDAYEGWTSMRPTQIDAARLLGVCPRTVRRTINRYEEDGLDGLIDKRLARVSHRRAPVDEVMRPCLRQAGGGPLPLPLPAPGLECEALHRLV